MKRQFLSQTFTSLVGQLSTGVALNGNDTVNQDPGIAVSTLITLPVTEEVTHRRIFAYLYARVASDAFAALDCSVNLIFNNEPLAKLPLVYSYKNSGVLNNGYRLSAFTWSDTTPPIILPQSITLKNQSVFGQPQNPPPDEVTGVVYLHPRPCDFKISKIQVDLIRWTNIATSNFRLVIATEELT